MTLTKNIHLIKSIPAILVLLSLNSAHSQDLRSEAIMNIGSSISYIAWCEIEKFSSNKYASQLIISAHSILSRDSYNKLRDQVQRSMHEKMIYSKHYDKWIPMKVDKESCGEIEKVAPFIIDHFKNIEQHQRKK